MSAANSSESTQTDWARLAADSDDDIDYSDIPPLDEDFFRNATLRLPSESLESVTLQLDRDVLAWFRGQGQEYQQRINAILRAYKETHDAAR